MKSLRKRSTWILFAILLLSLLASCLWYGRQVRQQRLDRALIEAIKSKNTAGAIALLDSGADANVRDRPSTGMTFKSLVADFWNRLKGNAPTKNTTVYPSALLLPYWSGGPQASLFARQSYPEDNPELVRALLTHGADPYARDGDGFTVLHHAAALNHIATVRVLLELRMDPNVKNRASRLYASEGVVPVMLARYDCARLLIESGADVNSRDSTRKTPLMWSLTASGKKYELLLDHGADINAQDDHGNTALMYSVLQWHDSHIIRLLLQHGAKVSFRARAGKTVLDCAHRRGEPGILHLLEEAILK